MLAIQIKGYSHKYLNNDMGRIENTRPVVKILYRRLASKYTPNRRFGGVFFQCGIALQPVNK